MLFVRFAILSVILLPSVPFATNHAPLALFLPWLVLRLLSLASETLWDPDPAAASHITPDEGILSSKTSYSSSAEVEVSNGQVLPITNTGTINIQTCDKPFSLHSALHVPQLKHNLLSVRRLRCENNCRVQFSNSVFISRTTTPQVMSFYGA